MLSSASAKADVMERRFDCESTLGSILDTAYLSLATTLALLACFVGSCYGLVVDYAACSFDYRLNSSFCLSVSFNLAFSSRFVAHPEVGTLAPLVFGGSGK